MVCLVWVAWVAAVLPGQKLTEVGDGARPDPGEAGFVALQQAVRDAGSDNLALLVASHPDDRYVLPAAYLRFEHGMRVAIVLFTRGKGGQNSRGPETGDALGAIRTRESERCAAHIGASVYYLNRPDRGYSRSAEETLAQWDEESTVDDLARLIRKIQPDMVLTTHHAEENHGHDRALIRILPKAVSRSADPEFKTPGVPAFVVSRLFRGAMSTEDEEVTVSLSMDLFNEARGRTYRQLAYAALLEHESQAPLIEMDALLPPILEMVSVPIGDQPLRRTLRDRLPDVFQALRAARPDAPADALREQEFDDLQGLLLSRPALSDAALKLLGKVRKTPAVAGSDLDRRLRRRQRALERVARLSAGVHVFMRVPTGMEAAPGEDLPLQMWIGNEGHHEVSRIRVSAVNGGEIRLVGPGKDRTHLDSQESLALEAVYRAPNFSEDDLARFFTRDTFESPLRLRFEFAIDGQPIAIEERIPTRLQPAVQLTVTPRTLLIPLDADEVRFVVAVDRKNRKQSEYDVRIKAPATMRVDGGMRTIRMAAYERFRELTFTLKAPNARPGVGAMHVHVGDQRIRVDVHRVDVAVRRDLRVGLIPGVDNTSYEILQSLVGDRNLIKFEPSRTMPILDPGELDTVVVDVRALRTSKNARSGFARLLEFVHAGGRLVVFYHKDNEFNLEQAFFRGAPYPLTIGKGRVTREDAPVRLLVPGHGLFRAPNVLRPQDWDGWKQERGLYFPKEFDPRYETLIEMNDPGEPPERGALLYAKYGKGDYIYCALSLYRQLKNRHPGACRLFANLVSPRAREGR